MGYDFYNKERVRNKIIVDSKDLGYYLRCYGEQKNCDTYGNLGVCKNVTIITPSSEYQDSLCIKE